MPGTKNVIKPTLTDPQEVSYGAICKSFGHEWPCYRYLTQEFPLLPEAKVEDGVVDAPHIREIITDSTFTNFMNDLELRHGIRSRRRS